MIVSAVAVVSTTAAGVLALLLGRERRRHRALLEATRPRPDSPVLQGTQKAMKIAVDAASRLKSHGVGGTLIESLEDLTRWAAEDRAELVRVTGADGTVTFMFTDIENSTALNEQVGDRAWVRILKAHDLLVRRHVTPREGHIVKSQGDGFMIAFRDPEKAIAAAIAIQHGLAARSSGALRRTPIAVRIGLHRGTAVSRDGDYFGRTVAMAARVASQARADEILVSEATLKGLPDPARFRVRDPRQTSLKGLNGEHTLHPVDWPLHQPDPA
ncbi:adenylate/guanylate cyclase domain-containing protein [Actinocorallia longicatena]|uniref:Guanylate cyclase domain-containing protein n=1 Tax=Actinocorallia longicatena TaxID=111803 RepID=A0ABP6QGM6_9ACTN